MLQFKIRVPFDAGQVCLELHGQLFSSEQVAMAMLERLFSQHGIDYRIKRTDSGQVFLNTQQGELARVIPCPMT
jgi:hypothetical protein